jgi:hypothetical protein
MNLNKELIPAHKKDFRPLTRESFNHHRRLESLRVASSKVLNIPTGACTGSRAFSAGDQQGVAQQVEGLFRQWQEKLTERLRYACHQRFFYFSLSKSSTRK